MVSGPHTFHSTSFCYPQHFMTHKQLRSYEKLCNHLGDRVEICDANIRQVFIKAGWRYAPLVLRNLLEAIKLLSILCNRLLSFYQSIIHARVYVCVKSPSWNCYNILNHILSSQCTI